MPIHSSGNSATGCEMTPPLQPSHGHDQLEARILDFVAEELVVDRKKLKLSSAIVQDLRVDGDDAMDFFEAFQKEFTVDLQPLWASWNRYFHPERHRRNWQVVVVFLASLALGMIIHSFVGVLPWWTWTLAFLGVSMFKIVPLVAGPDLPAIRLQDLLNAARVGRWVKWVQGDEEIGRALE